MTIVGWRLVPACINLESSPKAPIRQPNHIWNFSPTTDKESFWQGIIYWRLSS
jgi:hypothetical protein